MAISEKQFKAAMSTRAAGVAIVTACHGERVHGMTVTDWAGVSVDPPLVLVCADKSSNTLGLIDAGQCFAINVLAAGEEALSNRFASKKDEWRRFDGLEWVEGETGAPLLQEAITCIDCAVVAAHDAGDHIIYVGRVEEVIERGGEPLVYFAGAYQKLVPSE